MLRLWLSTDRRENSAQLLREITARAKAGQRRMVLLVPEQFSHETERRLCAGGGDAISLHAEVLTFSRLASRVFAERGGVAETETDGGGKLLMMALAVEQVRSRLKIFGASAARAEFLLQLLDMLEEFRSFCVTADQLRRAAAGLTGTLAVKTEEFALLMESYDAVCAQIGQNPQSRLTRLLNALEDCDDLSDREFWIDGFTDFNGVERNILAQLLNGGAGLTVALLCDGLHGHAQQYAAARETAAALCAIAAQQQIPVETRQLPPREESSALARLRAELFGGAMHPWDAPQDAVAFLSSGGRTEECRTVAGEILKLVEQGARWRDIAVTCTDYAAYRPMLESILKRAEIPAYFAGDRDILQERMIDALLTALNAAAGGMETEDVLAWLKSDYSGLARERVDRLENYALIWSIRGAQWEKPWTKSPFGMQKRTPEERAPVLDELNADRAAALTPLLHLRGGLRRAANTGEMVLALNRFLEEIDLAGRLQELAQARFDAGDLQRAQEYAQLYGIFTTLLEQLYGVLGQTVRSVEEFVRMLRTALSRYSVGTIPAALDCVNVGSVLSQRQCDCDFLFVLGANEGQLPSAPASNGLLTDHERGVLKQQEIEIMPTAAGRLERELAAIGSMLCGVKKRLFLSAQTGTEAYLLRRARKLFPLAETVGNADALFTRSAWDYLTWQAAHGGLEAAGREPALRTAAQRLHRAADYAPGRLSPEGVQSLYRQTVQLSSSKIEELAECRFRFYLDYGLRAQERRAAELDASAYGIFVHAVLEEVARRTMQEGGFHAVPLERVLALTDEAMERYAAAELGDLLDTERANYLFRRSFDEVRAVVSELYRELSQSEFVPQWFELNFSQKRGDLPPIRIAGQNVALVGKIDRADLWRDGDRVYVRVVDYKTGQKKLEYGRLLQGLGLQMLLYLFALERSGLRLTGEKLHPAGVLYFPARVERVALTDRLDAAGLERERRSKKRRSGLLLDSDAVLHAMEPTEDEPEYLPYKIDKNGARKGDLMDGTQLRELERHVFSTVERLAQELTDGEISPNPFAFGAKNDNVCCFCPYGTVCGDGKNRQRWLKSGLKPEEFWSKLEEAEHHG